MADSLTAYLCSRRMSSELLRCWLRRFISVLRYFITCTTPFTQTCIGATKLQPLIVWYSGKTSVCLRQTFPVLHSTCSWWVNTYVGKPSATTSANWANSAFHPSDVDRWVASCNRMSATSLGWCHLSALEVVMTMHYTNRRLLYFTLLYNFR